MMDKELKKPKVEQMLEVNSTNTEPRDKERRCFIKKAIVAAPVILTVTSRPVWARNCTYSGQLSGNLSDVGDLPCEGEGCPAEYWAGASADKWHYDFQPDCVLFNNVFGVTVFPEDATLRKVIRKEIDWNKEVNIPFDCKPQKDCAEAMIELGCQSVAALQNSATSLSFDWCVDSLISKVYNAYNSAYINNDITEVEDLKEELYILNNQTCPYL